MSYDTWRCSPPDEELETEACGHTIGTCMCDEAPVEEDGGIVAEASAEATGDAAWEALRQWCSLVPGFRAITVDGHELVACDMNEESGASVLIEAPTARELCVKLGIEERLMRP